ncbi:MAG TPA: hypothetical protein VG929_09420 [Actinomycetota bacterium]|nr:hypothetical protein [Actinomycetota bacterium]
MLNRRLIACVVALLTTACTSGASDPASGDASRPSSSVSRTDSARNDKKPLMLPRGGRRVFPRYRVVAHYGAAGTDELGVLGEGSPKEAARALARRARRYRRFDKPVMPAMELIATVAQGAAGSGGDYSVGSTDAEVKRYLRAVRKIDGLLILDVQPGQSGFLEEVKAYEKFLKEPDVGVALDPEWSMHGGAEPAEEIGWTTGRVVNRVSAYVAKIVADHDLPQKLFVIHQFTPRMVRQRHVIKPRKGLAITFHIDGFGGRAAKLSKYHALKMKRPFFNGFKLFLDEDVDMFSPREVMRKLKPRPDLLTYQ